MSQPGLPVTFNGRALRLTVLDISQEDGGLVRYLATVVDEEGRETKTQGTAHTLQDAVLFAARGPESGGAQP